MRGDNNLDIYRDVLIASLRLELKIDFSQIITNELFVRAHKVASALIFLWLITKLCRQKDVPLLRWEDNEDRATDR